MAGDDATPPTRLAVNTTTAFLAAGVATVGLALLHSLVPWLRSRLSNVGEGVAASVGGGVASAYVFLHLLPELARGNEDVAEALHEHLDVSTLDEVLLFLVAFAGFLTLYGIDHLAARRRPGSGGVFSVHLGVYAAYNALITYALPTEFEVGVPVAATFSFAMAVHFLLSDRALSRHHPERFARLGRPILVAALLAGFALAWAVRPTSALVVSLLLAALGGFVLYNVFSDELPSEQRTRFPAFLVSAGSYAGLLVAVAAFASP